MGTEAPITTLKLLIVGECGVGKSNLLLRFTDDNFDPQLAATIGVDFKYKSLSVNGNTVKLGIWDFAGQKRFPSLTLRQIHYRGAQGVILVYDVTSRESFQNLESWLGEVDSDADRAGMVKMLVGNKTDNKEERVVTREDGLEFARKHSMLFIECSARTAEGVKTAFEELIEKIIQTPGLWEPDTAAETVNLNDESTADPAGACGGCCVLI